MLHTLGLAGLFLIMIVQVIIPWIPAEIIVIGSAKIYGFLTTTFVAGTGLLVGSLICYYLGIHLDNVLAKFVDRTKLDKVKRVLRKHENLLLFIRVLPYNPSDIISYATGALRVPLKKLAICTIITSYVRCFVLSVFGILAVDLVSISIVVLLLICSSAVSYYIISKKQ